MAKNENASKYYKLKSNPEKLLCTKEGEVLIDENNEWQEINEEEYNARSQINVLKAELKDTDYVVIKIAEAETSEQQNAIRQEYAQEIAHRIQVRAQINELEEGL